MLLYCLERSSDGMHLFRQGEARMQPLNPERIFQTATAFWQSRVLLTAVRLGVFTRLSQGTMTGAELAAALNLEPAGTRDFMDTLVAMRFLDRDGDGSGARYRNTPEAVLYLDEHNPQNVTAFLKMLDAREYPAWVGLEETLRTGRPQGTTAEDGQTLYDTLYADPGQLEQFLDGMSAIQKQNFILLAERFDFGRYQTLCDVGGALALLSRTIAARHPHIHCISLDLPQVQALAARHIAADGLSGRVVTASGDFLQELLPRADIVIMSNILHNWGLEQKKLLVRKAFDAVLRIPMIVTTDSGDRDQSFF